MARREIKPPLEAGLEPVSRLLDAFLTTKAADKSATRQRLQEAWTILAAHYQRIGDESVVEELEMLTTAPLHVGQRSPTPALIRLWRAAKSGLYPTPEILAAVASSVDAYLSAQGKISLETALLGPPKRKAGTYAAAWPKRHSAVLPVLMMAQVIALKACTVDHAAEHVQQMLEGRGLAGGDADALARKYRRFGGHNLVKKMRSLR